MKTIRFLSFILCFCMVASSIVIPASAEGYSSETLTPPAKMLVDPISKYSTDSIDTQFSLSFSFSGPGTKQSNSYYYFTSSDYITITGAWSPSGEPISIGFKSRANGNVFLSDFSGGSISRHRLKCDNLADGDYYIIVAYYGSQSVEGTVAVDF